MRVLNGIYAVSAEEPIQLRFAISKSEPEIKTQQPVYFPASLGADEFTIDSQNATRHVRCAAGAAGRRLRGRLPSRQGGERAGAGFRMIDDRQRIICWKRQA